MKAENDSLLNKDFYKKVRTFIIISIINSPSLLEI